MHLTLGLCIQDFLRNYLRSECYQTLFDIISVQEEPFGFVIEDVMYAAKDFSVNIRSDLFAQVGPATLNLRVSASGD